MDVLITLIGDAAVDPNFRKEFLANPSGTIDRYGFRLTKGDYDLMMQVFGKLTPTQIVELDHAFATLQDKLYAKLAQQQGPCKPPCFWSIHLPENVAALRKAG